jgi:ClpP class serine protease
VTNGIAVLPVSGTLVSKTRSLQPYSGMTGYNGIIARLQQAMSDPGVDGIMLDMDTPGGMVSGALTVPTLSPECAILSLSGRWLTT